MNIDTKKGIPGVPLAALDAIQDENARQVLRAIVDGWHVRNGSTGDGKSRFVTAAELGDLSGTVGGLRRSLSVMEQQNNLPISSEINRIITDVQASVMESVLFKELGDRITLINQDFLDGLAAEAIARQAAITNEATVRQTADTSLASQITTITASVNSNAAAIQTEITARVNGDNAVTSYVNTQLTTVNGNISALQTQQTTTANNVSALSSTVTTLQASVGTNTTAIQTEATARVTADNDIYSKYSVKIDTNGYVSGFGLISTANNSTPFSDFIVRADRFAIGSPSGPGITPKVPFTVLTTTDASGNPAGVYIDTAMIKNATIGVAKITNTIQSDNYVANTSGWFIRRSDGYAEFGNVKVRGDVQATSLTAGTVYTDNIVGNALTKNYSSSTTSNSVTLSVVVPSGAASVIVLVGLGSGIWTGGGEGGYYTPNYGDLYVDGATVVNNSAGSIIWSISDPAAGTYTVQAVRGNYTGTMTIAALVNKR